jgi:hypothetical protein
MLCRCGHARYKHIYYEGACRPGFVCATACAHFTVPLPIVEHWLALWRGALAEAFDALGIELDNEYGTLICWWHDGRWLRERRYVHGH